MTGPVAQVLVVGFGNTLMGDDGVGQEVAEAVWLQRDRLPGLARASVHWLAQLTPDLALEVSTCDLVVFIDAAQDGRPVGSVALQRIGGPAPGPDGDAPAPGPPGAPVSCWEDLTPAGLMRMSYDLYGRAPAAVLVTVSISQAEPGLGVSPLVAAAVPRAVAAVRLAIAASHLRPAGVPAAGPAGAGGRHRA